MQIQTAAGSEVVRRYDVRFTPTFVLFDAAGRAADQVTSVDYAAKGLRSLLATP